MPDNPSHLICFRIENCPCRPPLGAQRRWCSRCNRAVYVAPSGLKMLKAGHTLALCIECAAADKDLGELQSPTPEQLQEIADDLRCK